MKGVEQTKPGDVFGSLCAIRKLDEKCGKYKLWLCKCTVCKAEFQKTPKQLKARQNCGCICRRRPQERHGMRHAPEYRVWAAMIRRCCPTAKIGRNAAYRRNGIRVCARWLHSFSSFFVDMGKRPSDKHSIERLESAGNYCPDNCVWATSREQTRNTSRNIQITYNGKTQCLKDWATELGRNYKSLHYKYRTGVHNPVYLFAPSRQGRRLPKEAYT